MPTELSPRNPRVERVRDLRTPRGRRDAGAFAVEGPTLLEEALASGLSVREVYGTPEALRDVDVSGLEAKRIPVFTVAERTLARLSDLETPPGVVAVLGLPAAGVATILARKGTVLLLAGVADPGNAGTLVRSADAFGAAGVLFGRGGADPFAPKVVRAAMGSLFRLAVATVEPEEIVAAAAASKREIVAADLTGEDLRARPLPADAIVAIGNERRGVRDWLPAWDRAVRIPQFGGAESLNAAVAGSIILYEAMRCQEGCQVAEKP